MSAREYRESVFIQRKRKRKNEVRTHHGVERIDSQVPVSLLPFRGLQLQEVSESSLLPLFLAFEGIDFLLQVIDLSVDLLLSPRVPHPVEELELLIDLPFERGNAALEEGDFLHGDDDLYAQGFPGGLPLHRTEGLLLLPGGARGAYRLRDSGHRDLRRARLRRCRRNRGRLRRGRRLHSCEARLYAQRSGGCG